ALAAVDRRRFLPDVPDDWVYEDGVLPDGLHHSQPLTVARLCSLSEIGPDDRVLEVGTGSGYQTAVLVNLGPSSVVTIERDADWADQARARLRELPGVRVVTGDGRAGWPEGAPYDVVVVNAAAAEPPRALLAQTAPTGRLVMPIGDADGQEWQVWERLPSGDWDRTSHGPVRFVPLV
ncbi:MAG: protein-L-isoaspartate O-methyltransferase, partial [Myxococcota bacterium]